MELTPDGIVRLQYTGGTTGIPKGCVLTNHNVISKAVRIGQWVTNNYTTMEAGDIRALSIIPLNHIFGFMAAVGFNFVCGGSLVTVPVPDPDAIMDAIEKYQPATYGCPALLIMLLNQSRFPEHDFPAL